MFSSSSLQYYLVNHKLSEIDTFMQRYFYWEDTLKLLRILKVGHERIMQHLSGNADKM